MARCGRQNEPRGRAASQISFARTLEWICDHRPLGLAAARTRDAGYCRHSTLRDDVPLVRLQRPRRCLSPTDFNFRRISISTAAPLGARGVNRRGPRSRDPLGGAVSTKPQSSESALGDLARCVLRREPVGPVGFGKSRMRPDRGGHSIVKRLLLKSSRSKSPSTAQAEMILPLGCLKGPTDELPGAGGSRIPRQAPGAPQSTDPPRPREFLSGHRRSAIVLAGPERTSGMNQEHLRLMVLQPIDPELRRSFEPSTRRYHNLALSALMVRARAKPARFSNHGRACSAARAVERQAG